MNLQFCMAVGFLNESLGHLVSLESSLGHFCVDERVNVATFNATTQGTNDIR